MFFQTTPSMINKNGQNWHVIDLQLAKEKDLAKKALLRYILTESETLDTEGFRNLILFKFKRLITCQLQPHVYFGIIKSGDTEKLKVLRDLPSFDQVSLNFIDQTTETTSKDASSNVIMQLIIQTIITKQKIELEEGRDELYKRGYGSNTL